MLKAFSQVTVRGVVTMLALVASIGSESFAHDSGDPITGTDLFLISGDPVEIGKGESFPVVLYRVPRGRTELESIRTITTKTQGSLFVRPYYDQRVLLVGSEARNGTTRIDVVDMNRPTLARSVEVTTCSGCAYLQTYFFADSSVSSAVLAVGGRLQSGTLQEVLAHVSITGKLTGLASWTDLQHVVSFGSPGGGVGGGDGIHSVYVRNGEPVYSFSKAIPLGWKLPPAFSAAPDERLVQLVNTKELLAFTSNRLVALGKNGQNGAGRPHTTYFFWVKGSGQWVSRELPGDANRLRTFDSWIATEESYVGFRRNAEANQLVESQLAAIGRGEFPEQAFTPALLRQKSFNVEETGRLILFQPSTGKIIFFATGEPDSEVILISGSKVYIRVGAKILVAKILGSSLSEPQVVISDPLVNGIHWAFVPH